MRTRYLQDTKTWFCSWERVWKITVHRVLWAINYTVAWSVRWFLSSFNEPTEAPL